MPEERGPVPAELVAVGWTGHVPDAPLAECVEHRPQLPACLGQAVQGRGDGRRGVAALDQARRLEITDPVGEQVARDSGQAVLQVGVPARAPDQELPDDQERLPVADNIQRPGDRAILTVAAHPSSVPVRG